jgi:transcriptional regulator with PAS, ATPase and Fis domain
MVLLNKYKKVQEQLNIVGNSERIREVIELVMSVAPTNISVFISGESGVGKELVAKAIHELSPRKDKPIISVNLGAIPEGLLESELFGHEKGAFTGAIATKKGYFELAHDGSIFLDEIGETPLKTQVKLLRILESGEFMRVGSGVLRKVDVRIIAATNRDLAEMVRKNHFRKDLYYRLKTVTIFVPPLRERPEDILPLIRNFIEQAKVQNNVDLKGFTSDALNLLENYSWPGNVRELKNFIDSIVVLAKGKEVNTSMVREQLQMFEEVGDVSTILPMPLHKSVEEAERELIYKALLSLGIEMREMKEILANINRQVKSAKTNINIEDAMYYEDIQPIEEMEKQMIRKALQKFQGNKRKAANALQISERTLYRKLREYEIQ